MNPLQTLSRAELQQKAMSYNVRANLSNAEMLEAVSDIEAGRLPKEGYLKKNGRLAVVEIVAKHKAAAAGSGGALLLMIVAFLIGRFTAVCVDCDAMKVIAPAWINGTVPSLQ